MQKILFDLFAAGDGCFFIGLGGKNAIPNPSYEPYKCCPTQVTKGTKVAKATPTSGKKDVEKPKKSSKGGSYNPTPPPLSKEKEPKGKEKVSAKEKQLATASEKPQKGKKGFFGNGKYIWWW